MLNKATRLQCKWCSRTFSIAFGSASGSRWTAPRREEWVRDDNPDDVEIILHSDTPTHGFVAAATPVAHVRRMRLPSRRARISREPRGLRPN